MLEASEINDPNKRIQVDLEQHPSGPRVKITLEAYHHCLGWYTSGSLLLPLHQLPLLEQAIAEMRQVEHTTADIIPFPGSEITPVSVEA